MAERKPFLLRLDPAVYEALHRWAEDELRSLTAPFVFPLPQHRAETGRRPPAAAAPARRAKK